MQPAVYLLVYYTLTLPEINFVDYYGGTPCLRDQGACLVLMAACSQCLHGLQQAVGLLTLAGAWCMVHQP